MPSRTALSIKARLRPENTGEVSTGSRAARFTGVARKRRPIATGKPITVSADRSDGAGAKTASSEGYDVAQVRLDPNDLAARHVILQAGMPAQVVVSTHPRTMLDPLTALLSDQVERVFREE